MLRAIAEKLIGRRLCALTRLGVFRCVGIGVMVGGVSGCGPELPPHRPAGPVVAAVADARGFLAAEPVGQPVGEPAPWVTHMNVADLDRDGRLDILACEARANAVYWLRQDAVGGFEEKTLATEMRGPVHVEPCDLDDDDDHDLLVACMSLLFPNNDRIGSVIVLENDGAQNFRPHVILENVMRVTDVRAGDFNRDGKLDLVVGQFGYDQGEIRWLERTGPWEFKSHQLLDLSGTIHVGVADFDGDGSQDIVALVSQQWEEIHLFLNNGSGTFTRKIIFGSTNEDYGSSGLSLADLNRDGRMDVLFSNGDGFGPAATPGPRPWHGVQWLENTGGGFFRYHRIGDLAGAYSPAVVDLDRDGHLDVIACSAYSDWDRSGRDAISLMWFRNDGRLQFEPRILACAPKDLISLAVGEFTSDGPAVVTGGCYVFPPYVNTSRFTLWRRAATAP